MKLIKIFSILFAALFFCANIFALEGSPSAIPVPSSAKKAVKKWTVMVFMNAKNDLERHGLNDVNEMETIGSSDDVNIVVELGRIKGYSAIDGDWTGSKRYLVKKDRNKHSITSPALMTIEKSDMGDWKHLVDFTKWSMDKFPARHYMLIIWNHGTGWKKNVSFELTKGISYDVETNNHMSTPHLGMAMKAIGKIDILAMDACLMQMAEVAYEVKDYADYIVTSEESVPNDGYMYNTFPRALVIDPNMSAAALTKEIVESYVQYYQLKRKSAIQSSIKASSLGKFRVIVDDWIKTAMDANEKGAVKRAKTEAQAFSCSDNKDIYHFVQLAAQNAKNEEFVKKSNDLLEFMSGELIAHNKTYGSKYKNAYGLAAYLPNGFDLSYESLKWTVDSQWDEFIKWYND